MLSAAAWFGVASGAASTTPTATAASATWVTQFRATYACVSPSRDL